MRLSWQQKTLWPGVLFTLPLVARAADPPLSLFDRLAKAACQFGPFACRAGTEPAYSGLTSIAGLIGLVVGMLLALLGVLFLLLIISAGFRWMIARGNEQEIEKAKATLKSASVGLIVVTAAYAVVALLASVITSLNLLKPPPAV